MANELHAPQIGDTALIRARVTGVEPSGEVSVELVSDECRYQAAVAAEHIAEVMPSPHLPEPPVGTVVVDRFGVAWQRSVLSAGQGGDAWRIASRYGATEVARVSGCRCVVPSCRCLDPTLPAAPRAVAS